MKLVERMTQGHKVSRSIRSLTAVLAISAIVSGAGLTEVGALSQGAQYVSPKSNIQTNSKTDDNGSSKVDSVASATKKEAVSNEKLKETIDDRAKKYAETTPSKVSTPPAAGDIAAWKKINSDVVAWITISNTNINYPLVIGSYTDYYTNRGYYKEASHNGVLWFDSDTKFDAKGEISSQNAVIYGHNWTNCWRPVRIGDNNRDVMFAQLAAYDNAEFAAANPYIRIATPGGDHLYQVFSVFYTDLSFGYNYADGSRVPGIIKTAKSKSIHKFDVSVGDKDKFITLSTCTRIMGNTDNQRFVVMAKKIS